MKRARLRLSHRYRGTGVVGRGQSRRATPHSGLSAPGLEEKSWRGGRLVIRVRSQEGRQAEGFVSVASFVDITRRAGSVGRRLFAVLAGTETPADVAAIMSWFYEDPQRLAGLVPEAISGGSDDPGIAAESDCHGRRRRTGRHLRGDLSRRESSAKTRPQHRNWSRFMNHVFMAFRERRGPFGRTGTGQKRRGRGRRTAGKRAGTECVTTLQSSGRLAVFDRLFDLLVSPEGTSRHAMVAFDLTQYVCERLQPEATAT